MLKTGLLIVFICLLGVSASAQSHIVEISTNYGDMRFRLYDDTPKHRNAFIELANEGYYDGTLFYRVIENFLIQGGSRSSRNAPPGKRIGYGDPDKTVDDEILKHYFHKKGSLCAPRQPDEVNPFKQSDISQFFIVKGKRAYRGSFGYYGTGGECSHPEKNCGEVYDARSSRAAEATERGEKGERISGACRRDKSRH